MVPNWVLQLGRIFPLPGWRVMDQIGSFTPNRCSTACPSRMKAVLQPQKPDALPTLLSRWKKSGVHDRQRTENATKRPCSLSAELPEAYPRLLWWHTVCRLCPQDEGGRS